ncbi:MAG: hypothetical protein IJF07_09045 [Lachnospiraceae bacterium]|nr:hypothetical protein [Lachnospiraceae bacterium]
MKLELTQIYLPNLNSDNHYVTYENQLQPQQRFGDDNLKALYEKHEKELMATVEKEITEYVNCDDLCSDEDGMFPKRSVLTGEWYLRSVYFCELGFLSIETAFLGTDLGWKDDYLGLEVSFFYDEEKQGFVLNGVDSASI